jgi:hypothetical protein
MKKRPVFVTSSLAQGSSRVDPVRRRVPAAPAPAAGEVGAIPAQPGRRAQPGRSAAPRWGRDGAAR